MNGILIIDKEKDWTSNDVVCKVKGLCKEKVGHTGTLDPLATGVLPLLIGKATQLSKYLINHDKEYIATIKFGQKTTSGDSEGDIIEEKPVDEIIFNEEFIRNKLNEFIGIQNQMPPMYSAIKVNGKKLYEYARKGERIEIQPRKIEIYKIELINWSKENKTCTYRVNCSKGTYIRSLCEDIAKSFNTVGYMQELNRTIVGEFRINDSIKVTELNENNINEKIIPIEVFFKNKDSIDLNNEVLFKFLNEIKLEFNLKDDIYRIYNNNAFIGIGVVENKKLKRDIIL